MPSRNEELPLAVEIQQTEQRLHIYDGIVKALRDPRAVLDVILEAADVGPARDALHRNRFDLDEIQVLAVSGHAVFRRATERDRPKAEEHRQELAEHLQFLRTL